MKKLHTEDSKTLGSAVHSLVPTVVWRPIFFTLGLETSLFNYCSKCESKGCFLCRINCRQQKVLDYKENGKLVSYKQKVIQTRTWQAWGQWSGRLLSFTLPFMASSEVSGNIITCPLGINDKTTTEVDALFEDHVLPFATYYRPLSSFSTVFFKFGVETTNKELSKWLSKSYITERLNEFLT